MEKNLSGHKSSGSGKLGSRRGCSLGNWRNGGPCWQEDHQQEYGLAGAEGARPTLDSSVCSDTSEPEREGLIWRGMP